MPTIRPLPQLSDGGGEGQLKSITVKNQPAAAAQPQPQATPQPAPAPAAAQKPAPAPQSQAAPRPAAAAPAGQRPAAPPPRHLTPKLGQGPSLRRRTQEQPQASAASAPQRTAAYTDEDVRRLWDTFIREHPSEVILINTMRASRPVRESAQANTFVVTVENAAQQDKVAEFTPVILKALRDGVGNDLLTLRIDINQGQSGAHTWSEREVLANMLETTPDLKQFIDEFKLNLG